MYSENSLVLALMFVSLFVTPDTFAYAGNQLETVGKVYDFSCSYSECLELAERGDVQAQNELAIRYAVGDGVISDANEAVRWFKIAAHRGFAKAQSNLGLAFLTGYGIKADQQKAVEWWLLAAKQGEPNAQFNLGVSYTYGCGVVRDRSIAIEWYQKALSSYIEVGDANKIEEASKRIYELTPGN